MITRLRCSRDVLQATLHHLQAGAVLTCETMVLWLGTLRDGIAEVQEVYRPQQRVAVDFFHIPPTSMRAVMERIRETRFQILAQVHSHPEEAFHSEADDSWAIVRHVGAVSIVMPHFARDIDVITFEKHAATYVLDTENHWGKVSFSDVVEVV